MDNKQAALFVRATVFNWLARRRREKLDNEIKQLRLEIATYSAPRLTSEDIPLHFPSKDAAQAFGERWSRGGRDSFSVEAIDLQGNPEQHPRFDKSTISGAKLFAYPALFFGMSEAYRNDAAWRLDYLRAKKRWLEEYRDHLRKGLADTR